MSGHSKWAKIKHQKGVNDAKKGAIFTKLAKNIALAAKEGGADINMNFTLRLAVTKAKIVNMPADNIERAIKKGMGDTDKTVFQKVSYEGILGSVGLIIDCHTNNVNRTVSEVKRILEGSGGKMSTIGSISWNFEEKGLIVIESAKIIKSTKFGAQDRYEPVDIGQSQLEIMEIPLIEDIKADEGGSSTIEILVGKTDLKKVSEEIEKMDFKIVSFELVKISKEKILASDSEKERVEDLIERLEENDDVEEVWTNL